MDQRTSATPRDEPTVPEPIRVFTYAGYTLQECVAGGGQGQIWRAYDEELKRTIAIKMAHPTSDSARFSREIEITARLSHPSIATLYAAGRWVNGRRFYTMPFVSPSKTLQAEVVDRLDLDARLHLLYAMPDVIQAVRYAHSRQVVHRDLKPENVLLGEFGQAIVIDWGLAVDADLGGSMRTGHPVGTPCYAAPEQAAGRPCTERTDIYALGAMLYYLVSGRPPFPPDVKWDTVAKEPPTPLANHEPSLDPDLLAIVGKAMQADPARRYESAGELLDDLERYLRRDPVRARTPGRVEAFVRATGRDGTKLLALLATVTLVVGVLTASLLRMYHHAYRDLRERIALDLERIAADGAETIPVAAVASVPRVPVEIPEACDPEKGHIPDHCYTLCPLEGLGDGVRELVPLLREIRREAPEVQYVWIMRKRDHGASGNSPLEFVADADLGIPRAELESEGRGRAACPGERYPEEYVGLRNAFELPNGRRTTSDEEFDRRDSWGVGLSGYAPIRRSGEVIAVLGVDATTHGFEDLDRTRLVGVSMAVLLWLSFSGALVVRAWILWQRAAPRDHD